MNYYNWIESPKILVVDDDRTYQNQLVAMLRTVGIHDLTLADTAEEGIAYLQDQEENNSFDLVLLDISMPKLDGIEACLVLTESLAMENTPIMMVTGTDNVTRLEDAISVGAVDYVRKPLSKTILLARIGLVLENQVLKNQVREYKKICQHKLVA